MLGYAAELLLGLRRFFPCVILRKKEAFIYRNLFLLCICCLLILFIFNIFPPSLYMPPYLPAE